mmetsp:Transcript_15493/g.25543  ORF Transcript_15493/g.25543 Transcript_15493/m.25543 type:complete len:92 (+) Transcript_15493:192-467(+)
MRICNSWMRRLPWSSNVQYTRQDSHVHAEGEEDGWKKWPGSCDIYGRFSDDQGQASYDAWLISSKKFQKCRREGEAWKRGNDLGWSLTVNR